MLFCIVLTYKRPDIKGVSVYGPMEEAEAHEINDKYFKNAPNVTSHVELMSPAGMVVEAEEEYKEFVASNNGDGDCC